MAVKPEFDPKTILHVLKLNIAALDDFENLAENPQQAIDAMRAYLRASSVLIAMEVPNE